MNSAHHLGHRGVCWFRRPTNFLMGSVCRAAPQLVADDALPLVSVESLGHHCFLSALFCNVDDRVFQAPSLHLTQDLSIGSRAPEVRKIRLDPSIYGCLHSRLRLSSGVCADHPASLILHAPRWIPSFLYQPWPSLVSIYIMQPRQKTYSIMFRL